MKRTHKNTLLAAICLIAGLGISVWGVVVVLDALASSNWPTTEGTVTASGIEQSSGGSGSSRSSNYHARVEYTYRVLDNPYTSTRVSFKDAVSKSKSHAQEIADDYPVGRAVTVAFDPDDPENAVLEPGLSPASFIYLVFGLALLGLGVYTVVGKN